MNDQDSKTAKPERGRKVLRRIVSVAKRLEERSLPTLMRRLGALEQSVRALPMRLQRVTNQVSLLIELYDDYRTGVYRQVPWRSIAVIAGALIYVISPIDLIPLPIPIIGSIDDALVIALTMRYLREDLQRYCDFKGYDSSKYFAEHN